MKDRPFWKTGLFDIFIIIAMILLMALFVNAEPSNQYIKTYLDPFYRASMTNGQSYTYTLNVESPDKILSVGSAIISFDVYISPTVSFNLTINGQSCKNPIYTISTTYASAGQSRITFDCTNIINNNGVYNLVLKPTQANTGTITGWADITYINNPKGELDLHGTEYIAGDDGKMFLQFLDSEDKPVNNSECFLTIWYPNHSIFLNNTYMSYLDEGIYFKNFLVPSMRGVYPASAKCYKPVKFNNVIYYNQTGDNFESNSYIGGYNWSVCPLGDPDCQNGWDYDTLKTVIVSNATAGTGGCYFSNYCVRIDGSYGFLERGFPDIFIEGTVAYNITFKYKFLGFQTNELAEVYVFDGNWHLLEQIGLVGGRTNGVWYNASYYIADDEFNLETLLLGFFAYTMPSSNDYFYVDDVYIHYVGTNITLSNISEYQVLRGSGEVHISNAYNNLLNYTNNVSAQVWSYPVRNLTYYQNFSISQVDLTNYSKINEGVWNYTNRTLTYYENFTIPQQDLTNYSYIFDGVWNYSNRTLTYYQNFTIPQQDLTNYSLINEGVWNYSNRTLTYYPTQSDLTNYTRIDNTIYAINQSINDNIYAVNQSLSYIILSESLNIMNKLDGIYGNITALLNNVSSQVWSYPVRNLTYYENFTVPQQDLTNYSRISNLTAYDVWSYPERNLTYYQNFTVPQVDLTNYTYIFDGVWYYNNRTLTYYPTQADLTNYTRITDDVWNYVGRYIHGVLI